MFKYPLRAAVPMCVLQNRCICVRQVMKEPENYTELRMPSLFRFLIILGVIGGIAWGGMLALVSFVEPQQRDMQHSIPASKLQPR